MITINERYHHVRAFRSEGPYRLHARTPPPVQIFLKQRTIQTGSLSLIFALSGKIEKPLRKLDSVVLAKSLNLTLTCLTSGIIRIHNHCSRTDCRQRKKTGGGFTGGLSYKFSSEYVLDEFQHQFPFSSSTSPPLTLMRSRISFLAAFHLGISIFVPITSTTFAAIMEPTSPQTLNGIPSECA